MTAEQEEASEANERTLLRPEDEETKEHLESLEKMLGMPLGRVSHEKLWHAYESLPDRRSRYLSDENIRRLFRHLSWVEFRSSNNAMQRYMAFLDHCNDEGMELSPDIWNTAISFTAKWVQRTSTDEVRAAVETWMRMEKAGFEPTNVTFNILFDVAIRAGRYGLADTIFQELVTRKMPLNRYFRTSVIFYAGLQKNGDGVRNAFRDLVNGGEIVDTSIMNCVMLSLIRAGEGAAAENVFARMKELMEKKFGTVGPKSWQAQKQLGRFLDHTARSLREERDAMPKTFFGTAFSNEDRKDAIQKATPLAPNAKSYRILIAYHATTSGDFGRIRELMKEMSDRGLNVHGSAYFVCLKGFLIHGSGSTYSRSAWNRQALEELWLDLLAAADASSPSTSESPSIDGPADPSRKAIPAEVVDEGDPDLWADDDNPRIDASGTLSEESRAPYFTVALACIALKVFHRYAGRRRMMQVWEEMQLVIWRDMTAEQRLNVQHCVDRLR
jgi:pentatricopeptide repeat protein